MREVIGWDGTGHRRKSDRSSLIYTTSEDGSTVLIPGDYIYRYERTTHKMELL